MGLTFCESCQQLEGNTTHDEDGVLICAECSEEVRLVPEHDDGEIDR